MKTLSIVVPVYNEEKTIKTIISRVKKTKVKGVRKEIIVVDDHSTDKTPRILRQLKGIKVITAKKNQGKGAAIRCGFKEAKGDIILVQDADLEYDPAEYPVLLDPILNNHADVVYGSRFLNNRPHRVLYFWHSVANNFLTQFSNSLTNLNLTDMETGYKVFKKEVIKEILPHLESDRFGIEPELTAEIGKLMRLGRCRIYEVGISYYGRTYEEGKKINWKDGVRAVWYIVKYNLLSK